MAGFQVTPEDSVSDFPGTNREPRSEAWLAEKRSLAIDPIEIAFHKG